MQKGLTGNQMKLLAVILMTIDHIGAILYPQVLWLRLIGRLAYPVFAYMVAEGCTHTGSLSRYFGTMAAMAVICQGAMYFITGTLYQYILVTFSLSIGLVYLVKKALDTKNNLWWCMCAAAIGVIWCLTEYLPVKLRGTDFSIDYGFWGVMLPVAVWLCKSRWQKLAATALVLVLIAGDPGNIQILSLCALPLIMLYNGQRGNRNLKYFFYIYFPAHMILLELIALLKK